MLFSGRLHGFSERLYPGRWRLYSFFLGCYMVFQEGYGLWFMFVKRGYIPEGGGYNRNGFLEVLSGYASEKNIEREVVVNIFCWVLSL